MSHECALGSDIHEWLWLTYHHTRIHMIKYSKENVQKSWLLSSWPFWHAAHSFDGSLKWDWIEIGNVHWVLEGQRYDISCYIKYGLNRLEMLNINKQTASGRLPTAMSWFAHSQAASKWEKTDEESSEKKECDCMGPNHVLAIFYFNLSAKFVYNPSPVPFSDNNTALMHTKYNASILYLWKSHTFLSPTYTIRVWCSLFVLAEAVFSYACPRCIYINNLIIYISIYLLIYHSFIV